MERVLRIAKKFLPFVGAAIFLLAVYAIHEELRERAFPNFAGFRADRRAERRMNCYFDRSLAAKYKSVSQQARVMTEAWVTANIVCPRCWGSKLAHLPQNTPLGDFGRTPCGGQYELKGKRGKVGRKIVGGLYDKCIERIMSDNNPDWLMMSCDSAELCVEDLWFVPKHFFVP